MRFAGASGCRQRHQGNGVGARRQRGRWTVAAGHRAAAALMAKLRGAAESRTWAQQAYRPGADATGLLARARPMTQIAIECS